MMNSHDICLFILLVLYQTYSTLLIPCHFMTQTHRNTNIWGDYGNQFLIIFPPIFNHKKGADKINLPAIKKNETKIGQCKKKVVKGYHVFEFITKFVASLTLKIQFVGYV